jgi:hypothetical protein
MGSGVTFIDYDGDGWQDIFFVNGRNWTAEEVAAYKKGEVSHVEAEILLKNQTESRAPVVRKVPPKQALQSQHRRALPQ